MTRVVGAGRAVVAASVALAFGLGLVAAAAAPEATVELTFTDPEIVESSGLVVHDGLVLTVNDSGDTGRVFAVAASGDTVGVTTWSQAPLDVEALAPAGDGEVWVGDIGDNRASRDVVTVARVPVGRGARDVTPTTYDLVYPGGPQDAETLMVHPGTGRLVVVTKGIFGGDVLIAPERLDPDRPTRLRRVGTALAIATDGAFLPDGRHLVVRGYGSATVYTWPGLREVGGFELPEQQQGEGLAVVGDATVLVSSEGMRSEVLRVELPRRIVQVIAPDSAPTSAPDSAPDSAPEDDSAPGPSDTDAGGPGAAPDVQDVPGWPWAVGGLLGLVALGLTRWASWRARSVRAGEFDRSAHS